MLDWRPYHKLLSGLWFLAQYDRSTVWQGGTVTSSEELRVVLNHDLNIYCESLNTRRAFVS